MNTHTPKPCADDPQFTAYALGELAGDERAAVEAKLRVDPALRAEVEEIRAAAAEIEAALAHEAAAPDEIVFGAADPRSPAGPPPAVGRTGATDHLPAARPEDLGGARYPQGSRDRHRSLRAMIFRLPRFYYLAGGLAAASFAVFFALRHEEYATGEQARATITRIARARSEAEDPGATRTAWVTFSSPVVAGDAAIASGPHASRRTPPAAGLRGYAAGTGPATPVRARENLFSSVADRPRSTFPIAVDTAGFTEVRRAVRQGARPAAAAVRVEELLNYFAFRYPAPKGDAVFAAALEVAAAPWFPAHRLVRIGLKGREAERPAVELAGGSGGVIAKDVRVQVEFNPARVMGYRLIGYEPHPEREGEPAAEAGEADDVEAGHAVTALYEIVPVGAAEVDGGSPANPAPLKYQFPVGGPARTRVATAEGEKSAANRDLLTVTVWYRLPDESGGRWLEFPLADDGAAFAAASPDFKFAAAVAQYGLILCDSSNRGAGRLGDVLAWATAALQEDSEDAGGYRGDFLDLVRRTQTLAE